MTAITCRQATFVASLTAVYVAQMIEAAKEAEATGDPLLAVEIDKIITATSNAATAVSATAKQEPHHDH